MALQLSTVQNIPLFLTDRGRHPMIAAVMTEGDVLVDNAVRNI
jgi:hypothetical protein